MILQRVGCDNVLGSDAAEDSCGVCKGNNSDCIVHRGLYSKHHHTNREYLSWLAFDCCDRTLTKTNTGRKGVFYLTSSRSQFITEGSQGKSLGQRSGGMEKHSLLACAPGLCSACFLYNIEPPAQGWHPHSGLGPPISLINQENASQTWPQASSTEKIQILLP